MADRNDKIEDLIEITYRLTECLETEIRLLRTFQREPLQALQNDKAALSEAFQAYTLALREPVEPDEEPVDPELQEELLECSRIFHDVLQENLRALRAMRDVNERVMRSVVEALEESRATVTGYTPNGGFRRTRRSPVQDPVSIAERA